MKTKTTVPYQRNRSLITLPGEEWRETEFEGIFVSNFARLRREPQVLEYYYLEGRRKRVIPEYILSQNNCEGYWKTSFRYDGHTYAPRLHRLVAIAFIGPPPFKGAEVNHRDGNKDNNSPDNLEWTTHRNNMLHGYENRLINIQGSNHGNAKLTEDQVAEIKRRLRDEADTRGIQRRLCEAYGVSAPVISNIKNGHRWTHVSIDAEQEKRSA